MCVCMCIYLRCYNIVIHYIYMDIITHISNITMLEHSYKAHIVYIYTYIYIQGFPKTGVPYPNIAGWFRIDNLVFQWMI